MSFSTGDEPAWTPGGPVDLDRVSNPRNFVIFSPFGLTLTAWGGYFDLSPRPPVKVRLHFNIVVPK